MPYSAEESELLTDLSASIFSTGSNYSQLASHLSPVQRPFHLNRLLVSHGVFRREVIKERASITELVSGRKMVAKLRKKAIVFKHK